MYSQVSMGISLSGFIKRDLSALLLSHLQSPVSYTASLLYKPLSFRSFLSIMPPHHRSLHFAPTVFFFFFFDGVTSAEWHDFRNSITGHNQVQFMYIAQKHKSQFASRGFIISTNRGDEQNLWWKIPIKSFFFFQTSLRVSERLPRRANESKTNTFMQTH